MPVRSYVELRPAEIGDATPLVRQIRGTNSSGPKGARRLLPAPCAVDAPVGRRCDSYVCVTVPSHCNEFPPFRYSRVVVFTHMDVSTYTDSTWGQPRLVPAMDYSAYYPRRLPRTLDLSTDVVNRLTDAEAALGRLAGAGRLLPNPHLLIRPYLLMNIHRFHHQLKAVPFQVIK